MIIDSAGARLIRIDKSLVPSSIGNDVITSAGVIEGERGLINQVYAISDPYLRERIFGKKNSRKYGSTQNELDVVLGTGTRVLVVRAGNPVWTLSGFDVVVTKPNSTEITYVDGEVSTVAGQTPSVIKFAEADFTDPPMPQPAATFIQANITNFADPSIFCRFFFKGEGSWNKGCKIKFSSFIDDLYTKGDHYFLSKINIYPPNNEPSEEFIVALSNKWKSSTGASLYIGDVLLNSKYISVIMNTNWNGADDLFALFPSWVTPMSGQTDNEIIIIDCFLGSAIGRAPVGEYLTAIKKVSDFPDLFNVYLFLNFNGMIDFGSFCAITSLATAPNGERALGITSTSLSDGTLPLDIPTMTGKRAGTGTAPFYQGSYTFTCIETDWCFTFEQESGFQILTSLVPYRAIDIITNASNKELWYAPAGYLRGNVIGSSGMARTWKPIDRRALRDLQFNTIKSDTKGIVFWSQKTLQTLNTAYQNIHVILAFISISRAVQSDADSYSFEFNDDETVKNLVRGLQNLADQFVLGKAAEEIVVDSKENIIGSEEIKIRWNMRYKGVAEWITISVIAYPSTQSLSVSMS